jgi:hypothetical protein
MASQPPFPGALGWAPSALDSPRIAKGEKTRLLPERERAARVVAEINANAGTTLAEVA